MYLSLSVYSLFIVHTLIYYTKQVSIKYVVLKRNVKYIYKAKLSRLYILTSAITILPPNKIVVVRTACCTPMMCACLTIVTTIYK